MDEVYALRFFYSFQIPRLGKEFDLLQIKDEQIVNIELKSGAVSDETIRKQLIDVYKRQACDRVIDNSGIFAETMIQIDQIVKEL